MVVLIKPQFEVGRERVGKGGIVTDPAEHARVVAEVNQAALALGLRVGGVIDSPILGADGNREFLALYELNVGGGAVQHREHRGHRVKPISDLKFEISLSVPSVPLC